MKMLQMLKKLPKNKVTRCAEKRRKKSPMPPMQLLSHPSLAMIKNQLQWPGLSQDSPCYEHPIPSYAKQHKKDAYPDNIVCTVPK